MNHTDHNNEDHIHDPSELNFTGERMIPKLNSGHTFYFEHLLRYLFAGQFVKNKSVLDLGCGAGYGSEILLNSNATDILGIDNSEEAINYAKKEYFDKRVKFEVGDVQKLPTFKKKFDVVIAFEIIEHLMKHDSFLDGIKRNITDTGICCISTPNKYVYPEDNHFHINELTLNLFEKKLNKYFKFVYIFNQQFVFSNVLIPVTEDINKSKLLDEEFVTGDQTNFLPIIPKQKSRYLVAVCSDKEIKGFKNFALSSMNVDEFSLNEGIEGLTKTENDRITSALAEKQKELDQLRERLRKMGFYKFKKIWDIYKNGKNIVLRSKNKEI